MRGRAGGRRRRWWPVTLGVGLGLGLSLAGPSPGAAQGLAAVDVVIGNNFGHLPMFAGVDKGLFKKHGVLSSFVEAAQRSHPEYFRDLPPLPGGAR